MQESTHGNAIVFGVADRNGKSRSVCGGGGGGGAGQGGGDDADSGCGKHRGPMWLHKAGTFLHSSPIASAAYIARCAALDQHRASCHAATHAGEALRAALTSD